MSKASHATEGDLNFCSVVLGVRWAPSLLSPHCVWRAQVCVAKAIFICELNMGSVHCSFSLSCGDDLWLAVYISFIPYCVIHQTVLLNVNMLYKHLLSCWYKKIILKYRNKIHTVAQQIQMQDVAGTDIKTPSVYLYSDCFSIQNMIKSLFPLFINLK